MPPARAFIESAQYRSLALCAEPRSSGLPVSRCVGALRAQRRCRSVAHRAAATGPAQAAEGAACARHQQPGEQGQAALRELARRLAARGL